MYSKFCEIGKQLNELIFSSKKNNKELKEIIIHPKTLNNLTMEMRKKYPQSITNKLEKEISTYYGIKIKTSTDLPENTIFPIVAEDPQINIKSDSQLYRTSPQIYSFPKMNKQQTNRLPPATSS